MAKDDAKHSPRIANKKAHFDYEILEKVEAGLVLVGSEVKSLRSGQASLAEAYARIDDGEAWLIGANIQTYPFANIMNHEPLRPRKLLLHRRQIKRLADQTTLRGLTIVPLAIYFSKGKAKCEIALAKGKTHGDKRETIRRREQQRDIARAMRGRR